MSDATGPIRRSAWNRVAQATLRVEAQGRNGAGQPYSGGRGSDRVQLRIASVGDDHLVCHAWDGTTEGTVSILVAKPYLLRKTPFHATDYSLTRDGYGYNYSDAQTRTSRRVSDSDDVTEYVTPKYVADDVIYATDDIGGGVGVTVDDVPLSWLDLNVDGRQWSE